jgi:DNA-binding winged helix-turn-helix (wHTH) protein
MAYFQVGELELDTESVTVRTDTAELTLFPRTHALLVELVERQPQVCTSIDLMDAVWGDEIVGDQNLKQRIYQLRSLLGPHGLQIETIKGVGYRLTTPVTALQHIATAAPPRDPAAERGFAEATALVDAMDHGKAILVLDDVLAREPRWATPRVLVAWCLMWVGRHDEARRQIADVLEMTRRAGGPDSLLANAVGASFAGDAVAAVEAYELVRTDAHDDYWAAVNLMGLYTLIGRDEDAGSIADELEDLRPGFYLNAWQRGFYDLCSNGDLQAAGRAFADALERNPDIPLPIAVMGPALALWNDGRLDEALAGIDEIMAASFDAMPPIAKDQALTLRARLLADLGDVASAHNDLQRATALHDPTSGWTWGHLLERALLLLDAGDDAGVEILGRVASDASALYRVQALGWLAVDAARRGEFAAANDHTRAVATTVYDGGWEWGYPSRPAFDRAQSVFPILVSGHLEAHRGHAQQAIRSFTRARVAAPERFAIVPVISLDGRTHLEATEGLALARRAVGDTDGADAADRWIARHRLECVMFTRAGAGYRVRSVDRLAQDAGTSSAKPMEKSSPVVLPE